MEEEKLTSFKVCEQQVSVVGIILFFQSRSLTCEKSAQVMLFDNNIALYTHNKELQMSRELLMFLSEKLEDTVARHAEILSCNRAVHRKLLNIRGVNRLVSECDGVLTSMILDMKTRANDKVDADQINSSISLSPMKVLLNDIKGTFTATNTTSDCALTIPQEIDILRRQVEDYESTILDMSTELAELQRNERRIASHLQIISSDYVCINDPHKQETLGTKAISAS
jgi:hypothetical protein